MTFQGYSGVTQLLINLIAIDFNVMWLVLKGLHCTHGMRLVMSTLLSSVSKYIFLEWLAFLNANVMFLFIYLFFDWWWLCSPPSRWFSSNEVGGDQKSCQYDWWLFGSCVKLVLSAQFLVDKYPNSTITADTKLCLCGPLLWEADYWMCKEKNFTVQSFW